MTIGSLDVEVSADISGFASNMGKAGAIAGSFSDQLGSMASASARATEGISASAAKIDTATQSYVKMGTETRSFTEQAIANYGKLTSVQAQFYKEMDASAEKERLRGVASYEASQKAKQGFEEMAVNADKGAFATAGAKREIIVLGHEILMGNFSKVPGSLMVLAERMGGLTSLMTPLNMGVVAVGATLAAGVYIWHEWGAAAEAAAKKATDNLADVTKAAAAANHATQAQALAALNYKIQSEKASLGTQVDIAADPKTSNTLRSIAGKTAGAYRDEIDGLTAQRDVLLKQTSEAWMGISATSDQKRSAEIAKLNDAYTQQVFMYAGQTGKLAQLATERTEKLAVIDAEYAKRNKAPVVRDPVMTSYLSTIQSFIRLQEEAAGKTDNLTAAKVRLNEVMKSDAWAKYSSVEKESIKNSAEYADKLEIIAKATKAAGEAKKAAARGDVMVGSLSNTFSADYSQKMQSFADSSMSASDKQLADNLAHVTAEADKMKIAIDLLKESESDRAIQLKAINDLTDTQRQRMIDLQVQIDKSNASWEFGAKKSLTVYMDQISNVAAQSQSAFSSAFKGMEDALVKFVQGGKLSFASLAQSIIADLIRIQIQQSIMKPLTGAIQSAGGIGSIVSGFFGNPGTAAKYGTNVGSQQTSILAAQDAGFSAAGGFDIPAGLNPITQLHAEEMVLPANLANNVRNATTGGNSMVVNIIESPGNGGQQSRATENGVDTLTIMVEKIKNAIAGDISKGSGAIPAAMNRTYGLNRTVGAY